MTLTFKFRNLGYGVPRCAALLVCQLALMTCFPVLCIHAQEFSLPLQGKWELALEEGSISCHSTAGLAFSQQVDLPGTLNRAGIGEPDQTKPEMVREVMLFLKAKHEFVGTAWYRKTIHVPAHAESMRAVLLMERVMWKSSVFVNGTLVSEADSLSTPHEHDLTDVLKPGANELVIAVDNTRQYDLNSHDMAHGYTQQTQIMWNGVLGDFAIHFLPTTGLGSLRIDADPETRVVQVITSNTLPAEHQIRLTLTDPQSSEIVRQVFQANPDKRYTLEVPGHVIPWDEFSPALYSLEAELIHADSTVQSITQRFGFRSLVTSGKELRINGRTLYLRGTLECCIFPLTGHPPVSVEEWTQLYQSAKDYGLNHLRFHSWCPPKAAFEAADAVGIYLQVEPPNWSTTFGSDEASAAFIEAEARRIIETYGNHPSFCLMSMGNELQGDFDRMHHLVEALKAKDRRRLYTTTSFTFEKGHGKFPESVDDFFITQYTDKGWVRGQGVFDSQYPDFQTDYSAAVEHLPVPLITHEIGQYSVYPNLKEIDKYTGVLDPVNFKAIRLDLEHKGLLHLAEDYLMASGMLAKILYKEEIERALKTEGISGFQLLDLHDFPGQGTALVGLLDAFWDSKGIIDGAAFRQFCSELVPLIWMPKAVYRSSEVLELEFGVANHLPEAMKQALRVELLDSEGKVHFSKETEPRSIPAGKTSRLGNVSIDLSDFRTPASLRLRLSMPQSGHENHWQIWIYPDAEAQQLENGVLVTRDYEEAMQALGAGASVVLSPELEKLNGLEGKFVQVFWSPVHFPDQPGTMGLLIDPEHPAFQSFPTEFHTNWQWWDLCKTSKTLEFGNLNIQPLIRVVDNFFKNRNLTNLFEVKVGKGKLVFSSMDLVSDLESRPEAAQLRTSLLQYMGSDAFDPDATLSPDQIKLFLKDT